MNLTAKDIGRRFRVRDRHSEVVLRALSKDGKTAFVDTMPEAQLGYNFKGRIEDVPVSQIVSGVRSTTKGRRQTA
jgi:hypothetical protein